MGMMPVSFSEAGVDDDHAVLCDCIKDAVSDQHAIQEWQARFDAANLFPGAHVKNSEFGNKTRLAHGFESPGDNGQSAAKHAFIAARAVLAG
jgi:hypothetical protein